MLRHLNELTRCSIHARDGDIGHCSDFLVDDASWALRYLVVKTTQWLPGRPIVLPPVFLDEPDWDAKRLPVRLTKQQVADGPPLDEHAPVSRQYEIAYHEFYTLPFYWIAESRLETFPDAQGVIHPVPDEPTSASIMVEGDAEEGHLRSGQEMCGYRVFSKNNEVGQVDDFLLDDETWTLRYLIVDTGTWLPGRKVLLSTQWLSSIRWSDRAVHMRLDNDLIKHSPIFNPGHRLTRDDERLLHDHYQQPYYWG